MTVGIVGLGLIGGSIGLALRKPGNRILGHDPDPKAIETALARQCIDQALRIEDVAQAEVVFVASPPSAVVANLDVLRASKGSDTVLTDCASVKAEVVRWARQNRESRFVPGHPMAGHEKSGAAFSSAWLFRPARWILCPLPVTDRGAVRSVEGLIKEMGGIPVRMDPASHDRQVAILSHLPHVFAGILVQQGQELESADVAAGSWKDLTRVGGVDPGLWTQILMGNRDELIEVLSRAEGQVSGLRDALEQNRAEEVRQFFEDALAAKRKHEPAPKSAARPTGKAGPGRRRRP